MEVEQITALLDVLSTERSTIENHWQELAERYLPIKDQINSFRSPGDKLRTDNYDSTAMESLLIFAAGLHSYLTNPTSRWFELGVKEKELMNDKDVKEWLQDTQEVIFNSFNNSNFNQQIHETYIDFGCFGTACLYEEEDPIQDIRFYARPPVECYIMENDREVVDVNIRKCKYDVRQAFLRWGKDAGQVVLDKVKDNKWTDKVEILHSVMPREKFDETKDDALNKPFESKYIEKSKKHLMSHGGYDEFPYFIPRQIKVSGETWGYSQSMVGLPDVKTLNSMAKTILKAAQKQVDPPIVVANDGFILPLKTTAGAVNYKEAGTTETIDVIASEVRNNIPLGLEMEDRRRQQIQRIMFVDMFLTLARIDQEMTATEVLERVNEKMLILGPILGRLMNELLDPLIHRTFGILLRKGRIKAVPKKLLEADGETTKDYIVTYISPLAKAQRLSEAKSINDFLVTVTAINNVAPSAIDNVNTDKVVQRLADIYNVPVDMLNDDKIIKQMREERAQIAQLQREVELLETAAKGAEKLSRTSKNAQPQPEEVSVG